jgi:putative DNA methylase
LQCPNIDEDSRTSIQATATYSLLGVYGSLPRGAEKAAAQLTPGQAFTAADRRLDRLATGPLWLKDQRIAQLVAHAILVGADERGFYELCAWVVMPNHVHLLIFPLVSVPLLMRWLKGSTARGANQILGRTGRPFWQDESFDRYLRAASHLQRTMAYIEQNPVSAGLVRSAEHWPWSSAGWQAAPPGGTACPTKASQRRNVES